MRFAESDLLDAGFKGPPRRRRLQVLAAVASLIGGSAASVLLFSSGLSLWGLLVGLGLMLVLAIGAALSTEAPGALATTLTYLLACSLLIWPVLLVIASGLWGAWQ